NNIGLINKNTLPIIINWLDENNIPYDEIYVGKPWCGHEGFYVDDKAIRPSEFINKTYEEIVELLRKEK
ncbi:TPA: capsular biosynthesis protein, partial [Escherichia coli]|nr:capsular biosynthesis protein [Escherichia coli]